MRATHDTHDHLRQRRLLGRSLFAPLALLALTASCSIERYAVYKLGDALAGNGATFASDDDIELVREAVPFSLKLVESVLAEAPDHEPLLLAATRGFTQYAYAFVQQDAERMEGKSLADADELRARARRLYLRARDYGLRGLEVRHAHFAAEVRANAANALRSTHVQDVALLFWTAAAWGLSLSISKDDPEALADQPIVQALIDRALDLDESFEVGAIHSFLINYEKSRPGGARDWVERARKHFERAVDLSGGLLAGPFVALAEAVSIQAQDKPEFERLLQRALAIDIDKKPDWRLVNLVMQKRARWLLSREDELFLE